MISNCVEKIAIRSLTEDMFVDELPLNSYSGLICVSDRHINRRIFRIKNREHKINFYPEE